MASVVGPRVAGALVGQSGPTQRRSHLWALQADHVDGTDEGIITAHPRHRAHTSLASASPLSRSSIGVVGSKIIVIAPARQAARQRATARRTRFDVRLGPTGRAQHRSPPPARLAGPPVPAVRAKPTRRPVLWPMHPHGPLSQPRIPNPESRNHIVKINRIVVRLGTISGTRPNLAAHHHTPLPNRLWWHRDGQRNDLPTREVLGVEAHARPPRCPAIPSPRLRRPPSI
jgi:hypothetical protein